MNLFLLLAMFGSTCYVYYKLKKFFYLISILMDSEILDQLTNLVCEIPRRFERSSPSNFRTQGSFIHTNNGKIFERDLLSSDSVAKSAVQKPYVF